MIMHKKTQSHKCIFGKTAIFTLILAGYLASPINGVAEELILKKGDRVAIVGDSITEQKQYSKFIELYLLACVPELDLTMFQFGWSGERAPGFANRMENDFVPWQPTVVTTCFGMNDGSYRPYTDQIGKTYEKGTRLIQDRCKVLGARMIVGGPGPVDSQSWRPESPEADLYYNENLGKLSEIAGTMAISNGFVYAKLHPIMMEIMKNAKASLGDDYQVCGRDGVHPGANGHLVMAYAFLKAMGLDGEIGTITVDMNGKTTATAGHKVVSAKNGNITIESSRYPFCFLNDTRSILPFVPFNQNLNRYILVVKNLPTKTAEIKWGEASKTFSKEQLEAGINLAAEFLDNPFLKPFDALNRVVSQKQAQETRAIKGLITNFRYLENDFPDDEEVENATAILRQKLFEQNDKCAAEARATVQPVTHTIQIIPIKEN
ncbi:MAG: SGNH/GDSL hydrolase family protein [Kiritimatiellae bacterium]|nr:SGNH/GDSL hydrolase family protein [Kiritimatiellia bacterium]